jgi:hypothetical protein
MKRVDANDITVSADGLAFEAHSDLVHDASRSQIVGLVTTDDAIQSNATECLVAQRDRSFQGESLTPEGRVGGPTEAVCRPVFQLARICGGRELARAPVGLSFQLQAIEGRDRGGSMNESGSVRSGRVAGIGP